MNNVKILYWSKQVFLHTVRNIQIKREAPIQWPWYWLNMPTNRLTLIKHCKLMFFSLIIANVCIFRFRNKISKFYFSQTLTRLTEQKLQQQQRLNIKVCKRRKTRNGGVNNHWLTESSTLLESAERVHSNDYPATAKKNCDYNGHEWPLMRTG